MLIVPKKKKKKIHLVAFKGLQVKENIYRYIVSFVYQQQDKETQANGVQVTLAKSDLC